MRIPGSDFEKIPGSQGACRCEAEGILFIPLIVDTFGGWHKDSLEVVSKLGRQVSRQEEEMNVRQLRQRVAILLVRDNVNMFDSRSPSLMQMWTTMTTMRSYFYDICPVFAFSPSNK